MPKDVPIANRIECETYGAHVNLVDGLISDCARLVKERTEQERWFDVSTLKEPFRLEGKKTMGYEVAEQLNWELPQGIIYPTGGGVGLIGMWKAFDEMQELGWIGAERPQMVAVQSAGCAPIPKAWEEGESASKMWPNATTVAAGLRVPKAYGDYLILDILRKSGGVALAVTDEEIMAALRDWAKTEGIFAAPEGAAALAAYRNLRATGFFGPDDKVVLFNTGTGLKYLDVIEPRKREEATAQKMPAARRIGRWPGGRTTRWAASPRRPAAFTCPPCRWCARSPRHVVGTRTSGNTAGTAPVPVVPGAIVEIAERRHLRQQGRLAVGGAQEGLAQRAHRAAGRQQDQRVGEDQRIAAVLGEHARGQLVGEPSVDAD